MANYKLVHSADVESRGSGGVFKMFKKDLEAERVALSYRTFNAHSGPSRGHKHEEIEEVMYIVSGNLQIKIDGEVVGARAGDVIRFAPQAMRAYKNEGDEEAVTIIASPILPDQRSDAIHR